MSATVGTCVGIEQRIAEGFAEAPRPTDVQDLGGERMDTNLLGLVGKTWQAVTFEMVWALRSELERFTPVGFRYYLPAFLRAALVDSQVADPLARYLARSTHHREALSRPEKETVRDVLRWLRDHYDYDVGAADALALYWDTPTFTEVDLDPVPGTDTGTGTIAEALAWSGTDVMLSMFLVATGDVAPVLDVSLEPPPLSLWTCCVDDESFVLGGQSVFEYDWVYATVPPDLARVLERCLLAARAAGARVAWFGFEGGFEPVPTKRGAHQIYAVLDAQGIAIASDDTLRSKEWADRVGAAGLDVRRRLQNRGSNG